MRCVSLSSSCPSLLVCMCVLLTAPLSCPPSTPRQMPDGCLPQAQQGRTRMLPIVVGVSFFGTKITIANQHAHTRTHTHNTHIAHWHVRACTQAHAHTTNALVVSRACAWGSEARTTRNASNTHACERQSDNASCLVRTRELTRDVNMCVCVCARACACLRVRVCVRVRVHMCVRICMCTRAHATVLCMMAAIPSINLARATKLRKTSQQILHTSSSSPSVSGEMGEGVGKPEVPLRGWALWNKSRRVMSHVWMSHVTHEDGSCYNMYELCHTYEWVRSHTCVGRVRHVNASCLAYEWIMSHIWMSHLTRTNESCHTYERLMSHLWMSRFTCRNKSRHIYACVSSHICMRLGLLEYGYLGHEYNFFFKTWLGFRLGLGFRV